MKKRLGLIIHNIHEEYCVELIKGVQKFCSEHDFQLLIFSLNPKNASKFGFEYRHRSLKNAINKHNIDAAIFSAGTLSSFTTIEDYKGLINKLEAFPMVHVGCDIPGFFCITSDSESAFKKTIRHLIEVHDRKKFLLLTSYDSNLESNIRKQWFLEVLKEKKLSISEDKILRCEFNRLRAKRNLTDYIMTKGTDFDCIVCLNDSMALGAIDILADFDINVPEQVIVTGFDNCTQALYSTPTLSTIDPQIAIQGYEAGLMLNEILLNNLTKPYTKFISSKERFRRSCGCLSDKNIYDNSVDSSGNKECFTKNEVFGLVHQTQYKYQQALFNIHQLVKNTLNYKNHKEFLNFVDEYMNNISLDALAIFMYDKPKTFGPNSNTFIIPKKAKMIFSSERNKAAKSKFLDMDTNPNTDIFPQNTFNKEYDKLIIYPLYETQMQYGYMIVALSDLDNMFYEIILESLSREITSGIKFYSEQRLMLKLANTNTKLKEYNLLMNSLSTTDELTQINNRRGFINQTKIAMKKALKNKLTGMVIFCDMDGLKKINDTYGHEAGDKAIKAEAEILRKACRSNDIIGRLGGDEFAIYSEGMTSEGFVSFRKRIENETKKMNDSLNEKFKISMSIGCTQFSEESKNLTKLLTEADKELYKEKAEKHSKK